MFKNFRQRYGHKADCKGHFTANFGRLTSILI